MLNLRKRCVLQKEKDSRASLNRICLGEGTYNSFSDLETKQRGKRVECDHKVGKGLSQERMKQTDEIIRYEPF